METSLKSNKKEILSKVRSRKIIKPDFLQPDQIVFRKVAGKDLYLPIETMKMEQDNWV